MLFGCDEWGQAIDPKMARVPAAISRLLNGHWCTDVAGFEHCNWAIDAVLAGKPRRKPPKDFVLITEDSVQSTISYKNLKEVIRQRLLPEWSYRFLDDGIEVHYLVWFSLTQFCSRAQAEWMDHVSRLETITGLMEPDMKTSKVMLLKSFTKKPKVRRS